MLNEKYASEIVDRWNTKGVNSGKKGFVTKFEIDDEYISRFDVHTVGASYRKEYWIPSDELPEFNDNIKDKIEVIATFE